MLKIFRSKKNKKEERLYYRREIEVNNFTEEQKAMISKELFRYGNDQFRLAYISLLEVWGKMCPPLYGESEYSQELRDAIKLTCKIYDVAFKYHDKV